MNTVTISRSAMLRVSPETRERLNLFVAALTLAEGERQSQDSAVAYLLDRYDQEVERHAAARLRQTT